MLVAEFVADFCCKRGLTPPSAGWHVYSHLCQTMAEVAKEKQDNWQMGDSAVACTIVSSSSSSTDNYLPDDGRRRRIVVELLPDNGRGATPPSLLTRLSAAGEGGGGFELGRGGGFAP